MRFTTLFSSFAAILAVNAAVNTSVVDKITQELESGDFLGAAVDILTLGDCDIDNLADCVGTFAPVVVRCGEAALNQGTDIKDDLECVADTLKAVGNSSPGFKKCAACAKEGISIAQSIIDDL